MPQLLITSRAKAHHLMVDRNIRGVLSIGTADEPSVNGAADRDAYLRLVFDDIGPERDGRPYAGRLLKAPTRKMVQDIIDFGGTTSMYEPGEIVLVHCSDGHSRATAAAMAMLTSWAEFYTVPKIVTEVRKHRPACRPSPAMILLLDSILQKDEPDYSLEFTRYLASI